METIKKFVPVLLSAFLTASPSLAVKTLDAIDEERALEEGRNAPSVCYIHVLLKDEEKIIRAARGTGTLIQSNIIATAAHLFSLQHVGKDLSQKLQQQIIPGVPFRCFGFITFEPDLKKAISAYEENPCFANLSSFFELDSSVVSPNYDLFKNVSPRCDIAFLKLKTHVEGFDLIPLYTKGTIPEAKFQVHNIDALSKDLTAIERLLIEGHVFGYGRDINQKIGQKRGMYQPIFIGVGKNIENESCAEEDMSHSSSDDANRSSESDDDEWTDLAEIEDDPIFLTAYFPGSRDTSRNRIDEEKHVFEVDETDNNFGCYLRKLFDEKDSSLPLGVFDEGDSGGPLLINGKLVAVVSQSNNFSEFLLRNVKNFADMSNLYNIFRAYYAPLFSYKTGELLPEVLQMIETLQSFPVAQEQELETLLLMKKKERQKFEPVLRDFKQIAEGNATLEEWAELTHKYMHDHEVVKMSSITADRGSQLLEAGNLVGFRDFISGVVSSLEELKASYSY